MKSKQEARRKAKKQQATARRHASKDAAQQLAHHAMELLGEKKGEVAAYWARGDEISAHILLKMLEESGYETSLPAVFSGRMVFRRWKDGDLLEHDALGLKAPQANAREVKPQIVFTPLLAWDEKGGRLGSGGGYYDRTLKELDAKAYGLAYEEQKMEQVPCEAHDVRLSGIATQERAIRVEN